MRLSSEAMTRAEFIQQATLSIVRSGNTQEHAITEAVRLAGKLEATEKAPWSNPNESVLLKRIEDEAHRRGYLLGEKDGRQYAAEELDRHSVDGFLADPKEDYRPPGSGDFSLGSKVWPGTSKVIEEMGELQQVLGKLIAVAGNTKHWDGDLRRKLVEELGDLAAALGFFQTENLTIEETQQMFERATKKLALFKQWHTNPSKP